MPPTREKKDLPVIDVDVRNDENGAAPRTRNVSSHKASSQPQAQQQISPASNTPSSLPNAQSFESRSFWKAGDYAVATALKPPPFEGHLEHARVHPKFLHSNATSHKWAFGAIAELLDNAVDEIHNGATFVKVDKFDVMKDNSPALLFLDNGGGMDPESIRKCMSLGYSSKKSKTTIGQYGNGFKTSTMRLGADVIVFSRATRSGRTTQSVGLLSYTFLRRTGQDDVIVPMIDYDISNHWVEPIIYGSREDWAENLKIIFDWSPFASKEELMLQFEDIGSHGTKIVIYNLWLNDEGIYELSFDDDSEDIRLRDETNHGALKKLHRRALEVQSHISHCSRYSLRAYASILYLRRLPNFKIILRGKPVDQYNIADELKYSKVMTYKPQVAMASKEVIVETTIGFVKEAPSLNVSGFNVYHKNRLIKPFWKVTADGSSRGSGVIGVLEANFIEPAHDKQDFERSLLFIRLETRLKQMVFEYWRGHCHLVGYQPLDFKSQKAQMAQKERRLQQSGGSLSNSQNQLQGIGIVSQHQEILSSNQQIVDLRANGVQNLNNEQHVTCAEIPESLSAEQICEENIKLFMRCEEYTQKEIELKRTVEDLEKELKEIRGKSAKLSVLLEAKRKQRNLKEQNEKV